MVGSKFLGAGLATISLAGAGVGIGSVFSALLIAFSRNPGLEKQLFAYAILGFAYRSYCFIWSNDGFFNFIWFLTK